MDKTEAEQAVQDFQEMAMHEAQYLEEVPDSA